MALRFSGDFCDQLRPSAVLMKSRCEVVLCCARSSALRLNLLRSGVGSVNPQFLLCLFFFQCRDDPMTTPQALGNGARAPRAPRPPSAARPASADLSGLVFDRRTVSRRRSRLRSILFQLLFLVVLGGVGYGTWRPVP